MPDRAEIGARAGMVLVLVLAFASPARAQVSPGPLSKAHAEFDGNMDCNKCHGKGEGEMDRRCMACHEEIALLVQQRRGFHGREGTRDCAHCHPDHGGRDFALIAWPGKTPEKFDHATTGWALKDKHATLKCEKCHTAAHVSPGMAGLLKVKREVPWVGLEASCVSCHEDIHRGSLGNDCASCHSEKGWRPVPGFDHGKTAFPLTGLHGKVECAKCHEAATLNLAKDAKGRVIPLYKPLPHGECSACHADPHKGALGPRCVDCHVTAGFKVISRDRFNHDRTRYPLRGKHAALNCEKCHDETTAWGKKPPFGTCGACHKDAHAGQAMLAGKAIDCAACHTVDAFKPSTFTVEQHATTKYPLRGAHLRTLCMDCHGRMPSGPPELVAEAIGSAKVWMHPESGRCVDCHRDPHEGRFSGGGERERKDDCVACHTIDRFRPSTFDVAAHQKTPFPLKGAHRATPCVACHKDLEPLAGMTVKVAAAQATLTLKNDARACAQCHATPHGIQFDSRKDGGACDSCHDENRFVPASGFDHQKVKSFKLEGKHRNVACAKCHPVVTTSEGRKMSLYRPLSAGCESCHAEGDLLQKRL
ncbi:MAG: hypothetical protein OEX18_12505 [Candidatus Krumholzibacteria bacterium]|nr:hypothetical protein [Candidatus Krumholzibacteria bacterium]MDH4338085.1 hypothetical protein [Candidatus Krumholzibacteria bacterium]MDH5270932.1 hypothetical protein [Candidatus Krumholzibacteria bacterium]MDH5627518.1 hypothetical protein [Candidatus Krumholzibacteria bacterium]